MTRKCNFGPGENEYCRISRSHDTARAYPIGRTIDRQSPTREHDGENDKQRRRISVACSRCRKRKIKCSGDLGNGQGCMNCRNAGTDPSQCQFLRVSSDHCFYALPSAEWPYIVGGLASAPALVQPHHSALHAYHLNYPAPSLASSSFPGASRLLSRCASSAPLQYTLQNSQEHYGYGVADGTCEPYGFQSPSQSSYIPNHASSSSSTVFGTSESMRNWAPAASHAGGSISNNFDNESTQLRYPSSSLSLIGPAPATSESQSAFPGMGSLASYLPSSTTGDRVLPNPRTNTVVSTAESLHGSNNGYFPEAVSTLPSKPQSSWPSARATSLLAHHPQLASSATNSTVSTTSSKSLTSESQEASFGYSNTLQTAQPSPTSTTSTSDFAIPTPTSVSSSTLEDHNLSGQPYIHNLSGAYNFSLSGSKSRPPQPPPALETSLLCSQPFLNLHQRQDQSQRHVPLLEVHRRDSGDHEARSISRTSSYPSINNTLR